MTIVELIQFLEPIAQPLGMIVIILLVAAGLVYLIKILYKPILIISGCAIVCYMLYYYILMMAG